MGSKEILLKVKSENYIGFCFFFNAIYLLEMQNHHVSTPYFSSLGNLIRLQTDLGKSKGEKGSGPSSRSSRRVCLLVTKFSLVVMPESK